MQRTDATSWANAWKGAVITELQISCKQSQDEWTEQTHNLLISQKNVVLHCLNIFEMKRHIYSTHPDLLGVDTCDQKRHTRYPVKLNYLSGAIDSKELLQDWQQVSVLGQPLNGIPSRCMLDGIPIRGCPRNSGPEAFHDVAASEAEEIYFFYLAWPLAVRRDTQGNQWNKQTWSTRCSDRMWRTDAMTGCNARCLADAAALLGFKNRKALKHRFLLCLSWLLQRTMKHRFLLSSLQLGGRKLCLRNKSHGSPQWWAMHRRQWMNAIRWDSVLKALSTTEAKKIFGSRKLQPWWTMLWKRRKTPRLQSIVQHGGRRHPRRAKKAMPTPCTAFGWKNLPRKCLERSWHCPESLFLVNLVGIEFSISHPI